MGTLRSKHERRQMEHSQAPGSGLERLGTGEERRVSPQELQFESLTKDETDALIREIEAMTDAEVKEALVYERHQRTTLLQRKVDLLEEQKQLEAQLAEAIARGKTAEAACKERDATKDALIRELEAKGAELTAREAIKAELTKKLDQLMAERENGWGLGKAEQNEHLELIRDGNSAREARVRKVEAAVEKEYK